MLSMIASHGVKLRYLILCKLTRWLGLLATARRLPTPRSSCSTMGHRAAPTRRPATSHLAPDRAVLAALTQLLPKRHRRHRFGRPSADIAALPMAPGQAPQDLALPSTVDHRYQ